MNKTARIMEEAEAIGLREGAVALGASAKTIAAEIQTGDPHFEEVSKIAAAIDISPAELVSMIVKFHDERLAAIPSLTDYPEMRTEPDRLRAIYRGMAASGMSEAHIAMTESFHFWKLYRFPTEFGKSIYAACNLDKPREKCRVIFLPESTHSLFLKLPFRNEISCLVRNLNFPGNFASENSSGKKP